MDCGIFKLTDRHCIGGKMRFRASTKGPDSVSHAVDLLRCVFTVNEKRSERDDTKSGRRDLTGKATSSNQLKYCIYMDQYTRETELDSSFTVLS